MGSTENPFYDGFEFGLTGKYTQYCNDDIQGTSDESLGFKYMYYAEFDEFSGEIDISAYETVDDCEANFESQNDRKLCAMAKFIVQMNSYMMLNHIESSSGGYSFTKFEISFEQITFCETILINTNLLVYYYR